MEIFSLLIIFALVFILVGFSLAFHEYAHGWMANRLGDPTPKNAGRLNLNPLVHLDLFGTVILPILLLVKGSFIFGYAKPVPINPRYFKDPKKDIIWVSLAGPCANLITATSLALILKLDFAFLEIIKLVAKINIMLAILNLIPIPPLDGSKVLMSLMPNQLAHKYRKMEPYGIIIIFILIRPIFEWIILPITYIIMTLLGITW